MNFFQSSETKAALWRQYKASSEEHDQKPVSVSLRRLRQKFLPNVVMMRPATDLCWICQQNSGQILCFSNLDEEQKSQLILCAQLHLSKAKSEQEFYKQCCNESKTTVECFHIQLLSPHPSVSLKRKVHYSFNMVQQNHFHINLSSQALSISKLHKSVQFLECASADNGLLDEAVTAGKGANLISNLIHHLFDFYGIGETEVHLLYMLVTHGQNKYNAMLRYLMWWVLTGRHQKITLSFLIVGAHKICS